MIYRTLFKRLIDLSFSISILLLISPIFIIIAILLFIVNNGKPFFIQPRPGLKGETFHILKFKTMNDRTDINGDLLPDNQRVTAIGSFVRKTSLDELPQLINVIKGDMSLIGPRPLRTYYLPIYSDFQKRRHNVRPGITGWAQVNGRNAISWTKKFEYDVYYVDNLSFTFDMKILFKTFWKVVKAADINTSKEVTMEKFNGRN